MSVKVILNALNAVVEDASPVFESIKTVSVPELDNITGDCLPNLSAKTIPTWYVLLYLTDWFVKLSFLADVSPVLATLKEILGILKFCKKLP